MSGKFTNMKDDFDGFCGKCKAPLPKGTPRKYHRFKKQITCISCVGSTDVKSSGLVGDALEKRLVFMERLLCAIAAEMEVDLADELIQEVNRINEMNRTEEPTQTNFDPPKPSAPEEWIVLHLLGERGKEDVRWTKLPGDDPRFAETIVIEGKPHYYAPGVARPGEVADGIGSPNQGNKQVFGANS